MHQWGIVIIFHVLVSRTWYYVATILTRWIALSIKDNGIFWHNHLKIMTTNLFLVKDIESEFLNSPFLIITYHNTKSHYNSESSKSHTSSKFVNHLFQVSDLLFLTIKHVFFIHTICLWGSHLTAFSLLIKRIFFFAVFRVCAYGSTILCEISLCVQWTLFARF